jgi:class 3 adenylate cyclase
VMDACGMDRATVFGSSEGGSLSILLAAAHPDRVDRLVLHGTWARHPWIEGPQGRRLAFVEDTWGTGRTLAHLAESMAATSSGRRFLARLERQAATPRTARRLTELMCAIDVTALLPSVAVPTLVIHRADDAAYGLAPARDLTARIPGARLVELPGRDHYLYSGDTGPLLAAVEDFVVGRPGAPPSPDRFLATVMFADIVGSTTAAADMGDAAFRRLLDGFAAEGRRCVEAHRGDVVGFAGDGLVAVFDGPGRGVRAAELRAGVHTAEIERRGSDVAGIGVHIASRLAELAEPGSVWVSRTVTDLVAGCGLAFEDRGERELPGVAGTWAVFEAAC